MKKYIDADLLRKEIEKYKNMIDVLFTEGDNSVYDGENDAYNRMLSIIDSLQQEQPENICSHCAHLNKVYDVCEYPYRHREICRNENGVYGCNRFKEAEQQEEQEMQEEDLEKKAVQFCFDEGLNLTPYEAKTIARHFYELGLNTKE